jgi:uncharacterized spore protein YtfJ
MNLERLLQSLMERLGSQAQVKTVFGDPIECDGKTIVPVAKVGYGVGGGEGHSAREHSDKPDQGGGSGGGIGLGASPVGVVEVTKEDTRFIPVGGKKKLILGLILGFFLGLLIGRRR